MGRSHILRLLESKGDYTIKKMHESFPTQDKEEEKSRSKSMSSKAVKESGKDEKSTKAEDKLEDKPEEVVVEVKEDPIKPQDGVEKEDEGKSSDTLQAV